MTPTRDDKPTQLPAEPGRPGRERPDQGLPNRPGRPGAHPDQELPDTGTGTNPPTVEPTPPTTKPA